MSALLPITSAIPQKADLQETYGESLVVTRGGSSRSCGDGRGGQDCKIHVFGMDLPHSDACFLKAYRADTSEAFREVHVAAFAFNGAAGSHKCQSQNITGLERPQSLDSPSPQSMRPWGVTSSSRFRARFLTSLWGS